ncbi:MAG: phosphoribosylformylglycinamidine synthase [Kiritimatiellaeota bacterium]|nr:phosphoribosylformylglycinamidine synthase [Kiritimatiellota bacterium]
MHYRLEIQTRTGIEDPRGAQVKKQILDFLGLPVCRVRVRDVYTLFLEAPRERVEEILAAFANPVIQDAAIGESSPVPAFHWLIAVGFRPGVTDNVARSARSAVADVLGRALAPDEELYTSTEYLIEGAELDRAGAEEIAGGLLANELIQSTLVLSRAQWEKDGIPINAPRVTDPTPPEVRTVDLGVADEELVRISREGVLALTLDEMKAIQQYFREAAPARRQLGLPEWPTDVELEAIAQTWSEHCKHKIFNAKIDYLDRVTGERRTIDSLFKTFIRRSTDEISRRVDWLLSVFHDNAGVIRFNDRLNLVYKVETHNSPTALDPYGGAITGIVGVNRDPLGTGKGAELLINVWGYCFGSPFTPAEAVPEGLFHPRRLRDQVHKGVIDGGNQSGIPYAVGWEYFDHRYLGKPLVYCGTVGLLPREINAEPAETKSIRPGDLAVMVGGRIGKDGIHGATFSSEELHRDSPVQAVQIGDPITQKKMADFLIEARDRGLYRFITDNGAGGLSSSLGEMSRECGGCDIELANAPLKYAGLQPWEILLSEAQERMSLAVAPEHIDEFMKLARRREVEATVLGNFTDSGRFTVRFQERIVASLDLDFLHDGLPQLQLHAEWRPPRHPEPTIPENLDLGRALCDLMGRLNICSGEAKARQYDHEVKGLSVVKPYVGVGNDVASDAAVLAVGRPDSLEGVILAAGVAPRYSDIDPYHMMASVIDLAIRRTIAVGGRLGHMAGLDNFCWPDPVAGPKNPEGAFKLAQLVRANQALYDYTTAFGVPCISGKDSMKNDSTVGGRKISIPPTVLFSTIARMSDIRKAVTLDVKRYGDFLYVLGTTGRELGGSEFFAMLDAVGNTVPRVDADAAKDLYERVARATDRGLCHSLHTPALGGLGAALARKAMGGRLGLEVDLACVPTVMVGMTPVEILFSESNARFLATVPENRSRQFEELFDGAPFARIGRVTLDPVLVVRWGGTPLCRVSVADLLAAYTGTLDWE